MKEGGKEERNEGKKKGGNEEGRTKEKEEN